MSLAGTVLMRMNEFLVKSRVDNVNMFKASGFLGALAVLRGCVCVCVTCIYVCVCVFVHTGCMGACIYTRMCTYTYMCPHFVGGEVLPKK